MVTTPYLAIDSVGTASAGRVSGWLFVACGCVAGAAAPALPGAQAVGVAAAAAVIAGLVVLAIPWERLPRESLLITSLAAVCAVAGLGRAEPEVIDDFLSMYVLILAYVGFSQRARWIPVAVGVAAAGYLYSVRGAFDTIVDFMVTAAIGTLLALVLAMSRDRQERSQHQVEDLLSATRALTRTTTERETCGVLQDLVRTSLEADVVMVFLAEALGSTRYANACPSPTGLPHPLAIDVATEPSGVGAVLESSSPLFVPDARHEQRVSRRLATLLGAESLLFVPLLGEGGRLGAVVVIWRHSVRVLDDFAERTIEILSTEASSVLERQRDTVRANQLAETDPLTGLFNRRSLDGRLDRLQPGDALVMVDLDHFKRLNDRYGHAVGDRELRRLADCMSSTLRQDDLCGRIGGEEFLLILRRAGFDGGVKSVERLRESWVDHEPLTTFSAGIAVHEIDAEPRQTLARADDALYFAKRAGRDTYHVFVADRVEAAALDPQPSASDSEAPPLRDGGATDRRFDRRRVLPTNTSPS